MKPEPNYALPYEKGSYVARIVGPHGRFGLDREFVAGQTIKRSGRIEYRLEPGWYESRSGRRDVSHFCVTRSGEIVDVGRMAGRVSLRNLGKAGRRGETIDDPGAFMSESCWCGGLVRFYTEAGRPRCETHSERKEVTA